MIHCGRFIKILEHQSYHDMLALHSDTYWKCSVFNANNIKFNGPCLYKHSSVIND